MDLSDFQRKAVILIFISILAGSILLARKEPSKDHKEKEIAAPAQNATTPLAPISDKIDINTADAATLTQLPGIGPALAGEIVSYRAQNGNFAAAEDLLSVRGIGEKKLERIKEKISLPSKRVVTQNTSATNLSISTDKNIPPQPDIDQYGRINLNTATSEQLQTIPRIGPKIAAAIIEYRNKQSGFKKLDELLNVPNIGEKKLTTIKEYAYLETDNTSCPSTKTLASGSYVESASGESKCYDSRKDPNIKCPHCGEYFWESGNRKQSYIRCPHCMNLLNKKENN